MIKGILLWNGIVAMRGCIWNGNDSQKLTSCNPSFRIFQFLSDSFAISPSVNLSLKWTSFDETFDTMIRESAEELWNVLHWMQLSKESLIINSRKGKDCGLRCFLSTKPKKFLQRKTGIELWDSGSKWSKDRLDASNDLSTEANKPYVLSINKIFRIHTSTTITSSIGLIIVTFFSFIIFTGFVCIITSNSASRSRWLFSLYLWGKKCLHLFSNERTVKKDETAFIITSLRSLE